MNENQIENKFIVPYKPNDRWKADEFFAKDYFIWPVGAESKTVRMSSNLVNYKGLEARLSNIIPVEVYNNTAYSIVAETDTENSFSFFTEKIAKPLLTKRLFIVFSGYKYLENLRKLGFKTFDGIIDESYDLIENTEDRFQAICNEVTRINNFSKVKLELFKPKDDTTLFLEVKFIHRSGVWQLIDAKSLMTQKIWLQNKYGE